jgi:hypothetical protein
MAALDVEKIDVELATEDFDAISHVNTILRDKASLSELPRLIQELNIRGRRTTASIRKALRSYSALGETSDAILADTRKSIVDLSERIAVIHSQATQTQTVVSRICEGIKPLDRAKCNLTATVTTLRRLKMILETLDQLDRNVSEANYSQCAENVLALTSLFDYFKKYLPSVPQISPLAGKFFDLKRQLRNKVNVELEGRLFRGSADETNLPLCSVIDAYDDDFRPTTIDLFCEKFIGPYDDAYSNSPLRDVQTRYQWFRQRLERYNRQYQSAFPREWRMPYHLSLCFCRKTAAHLARLMAANEPDVKVYLQAFELTVKFEQKMTDLFTTTETVPASATDPDTEFENTPEGVRRRVEWRMRRERGEPDTRRVPAGEFVGSIASAFARHMSLYLHFETEALKDVIKAARKTQEFDPEHQLTSVRTLVVAMRAAIEKCAGFNLPQSLLDLFMSLKRLLVEYVQTLTRTLPAKPRADSDYQLLCAVANTSALLFGIVDSLATKVSGLVSDELRPSVRIDDVKDEIGTNLRRQVVAIVDGVVAECAPALAQVGSGVWDQTTPDSAKLPAKLGDVLRSRFGVVGEWLSQDNMNRLRSTLASRVVAVVHETMFKQKQLNNDLGWKISVAVKELKNLVMYWTQAASALAKRRIDGEFAVLETEVRVLCSPDPEAMAVTYITMLAKPAKEHFRAILKLRGLPAAREQTFLEEYDRQLAVLAAAK